MAFVVNERIKETTATTGTGAYAVDGAAVGHQAFSVLGAGNTCPYLCTDNVNWEVGIGTVSLAPNQLARTTILASSNAGTAINWGAGTKDIACVLPGKLAVILGQAGGPAVVSAFVAALLDDVDAATARGTLGAAAAVHNHDADYVNVAGDTMTGPLTLTGDPTAALHSAPKQYVDAKAAAEASNAAATAVPAGTIIAFGNSIAPSGYLDCNGQNVSRTTYAALFAAIAITWGAGDGSTTFALPDLRRRTIIGQGGVQVSGPGSAVGQVGGAETHTLTTTEMPSHTHGVTDPGHTHALNQSVTGATDGFSLGGSGTNISGSMNTGVFTLSAASATTGISIGAAGSGAAHNNMQPCAVVGYFIKY